MIKVDQDSVSLFIDYEQASSLPASLVIPDILHTRPHRYVDLICIKCGHSFPVPVYCGFRFCRICSVKRQARVRSRLKWLISQIQIKKPYGFKHLTLTIPNGQDLPTMVKKLVKSFRRLRQRAYWKNHVNGGAFVIEITGHPGDWHAHIHAIIEAKYMDWSRLHKLWKSCSGGLGLYLQKISPTKCLNYLCKYLTKSGVTDQTINEMSDALKGSRLFSPFGQWYAINATYINNNNPCPQCNDGDVILNDFFLYGRWVGSYTRYD